MKKIPFNIKYKQDIIDGKVKVFTKNGSPVEIVYWNLKNAHYDIDYPILAVINGSSAYTYTKDGIYSTLSKTGLDLVIEVSEPKFKEGDKIVGKDGRVCTIINITKDILSNGYYAVRYTEPYVSEFNIIMLEDEDKYHLYQELPEWEKDNTSSTKLKPYIHYNGYKISLDEVFEKLPKKE